MKPFLQGITLRRPGEPPISVWDPAEARRLVEHAVRLEARFDRQIPHEMERELNAAMKRKELLSVRTWVDRIEQALRKETTVTATSELTPAPAEQHRFKDAPVPGDMEQRELFGEAV